MCTGADLSHAGLRERSPAWLARRFKAGSGCAFLASCQSCRWSAGLAATESPVVSPSTRFATICCV